MASEPSLPLDDPYAVMARYYDAENAGLVEDLAAYEALVGRFGGPVLDVGCGTGRVALHMARQGVRVVGIDTSGPMLERARQHAERQRLAAPQIELLQADITTLALDERFRLALLTYNTFMHFIEQEQQIAVLQRITAHLEPGGALALDLPNPIEMFRSEDIPALVLERTFSDSQTGHQVMQQSVVRLDRAAQVMDVTWVYDRVDPAGRVSRAVIPLRLRYTLAHELRLLLERAGFAAVERCGDYDFAPYDEDSPRLFTIAVMPAEVISAGGATQLDNVQ